MATSSEVQNLNNLGITLNTYIETDTIMFKKDMHNLKRKMQLHNYNKTRI